MKDKAIDKANKAPKETKGQKKMRLNNRAQDIARKLRLAARENNRVWDMQTCSFRYLS